MSAFISPVAPDTVFVWQIGVAETDRGRGVARRLLLHLLARPACRNVVALEATVAPSNSASRGMFRSVAEALDAPFSVLPGFTPELFPGGAHETEDLVRIAPLPPSVRAHPLATVSPLDVRARETRPSHSRHAA